MPEAYGWSVPSWERQPAGPWVEEIPALGDSPAQTALSARPGSMPPMPSAPDEYLRLRSPDGGDVRITRPEWDALKVALINQRPLDARQALLLRACMHTWGETAPWAHDRRKASKPDPPLRQVTVALFHGGPLAGLVKNLPGSPTWVCGTHGLEECAEKYQAIRLAFRGCMPYVRDERTPAGTQRALFRYDASQGERVALDCGRRGAGWHGADEVEA